MIAAWQFTITCSCGATAFVRPKNSGIYECSDRRWRYHAEADRFGDVLPAKSRLWHCGEDGHRQMEVVEWTEETKEGNR